MSRSRTILTACSVSCTRSFPLRRTGKRTSLQESFWDYGTLNSSSRQRHISHTCGAHISVSHSILPGIIFTFHFAEWRFFSFLRSWVVFPCAGMAPAFAKKWFWESCETFSMNFSSLVTAEGEAFRRDCKEAGKSIAVWTVNAREEMMQVSHLELSPHLPLWELERSLILVVLVRPLGSTGHLDRLHQKMARSSRPACW